jgi:cardiolipin synthase
MSFKEDFLKIPNLITFYRFIASFLIPFLWIKEVDLEWIYFFLITGALSDALDGNLARLLKQKTPLGKILDPLADKLFINMLFFLLYWMDRIDLSLFSLIFGRDLFILLGAFYLFKRGHPLTGLNPTLLGKASTVFQLLSLLVLYIDLYLKNLPGEFIKQILNLTIFFTAASGFHYLLIFKRLCLKKVIPHS